MISKTREGFDVSPQNTFDEIEDSFKALDAHSEKSTHEHLSLESFIQALPHFPETLSSFQISLAQSLYSSPQTSLESYSTATPQVLSVLILEGLEELNRDKAKTIIKGSQSVVDWLHSVLDHLHETTQSFIALVGNLEHQLKNYKRMPAAKGFLIYKSIPRNLSYKGEVKPQLIPKHLDQFLIKAKVVRDSCDSKDFKNFLEKMNHFTSSADDTENTKAVDDVFLLLKEYLKTILPDTTTEALEHLQKIEGRVLMYDPTEYISDHRFYAYAPIAAEGAVSTVISGIIRVDQAVDLKQEVPYLSPKECQAIMDVVKKHLHDFDDHDRFKETTLKLREIQTELFKKYTKAQRMRKDKIDAKPYVLLMNICAGLVYGMHVKALNKSVAVITAALRYVSKSVKALETEHSTTPSSK